MVGALSYRIAGKYAVSVAWRYMYTDYSKTFHTVTTQSGIVIGVTRRWCCAQ